MFKLIAGRSPDADDLASQPTLSRCSNAITAAMLRRLQDVFIDQLIASFDGPPARLTLDIDTYDDRRGRLVRKVDQAGITYAYRSQAARTKSPCDTHGRQQLTFFHGYYDQYQPRVITCAENDQVVMLCLLFGTAH